MKQKTITKTNNTTKNVNTGILPVIFTASTLFLLLTELVSSLITSNNLWIIYQKGVLIALGAYSIYHYLKKDRGSIITFFSAVIIADFILKLLFGYLDPVPLERMISPLAPLFSSIALYSLPKQMNNVKKEERRWATHSEYAVELIDVVKDYVVGNIVVHALRGMSFKVRKGEFVAIMGPSGSGKSTTLNLIGALDRPTSGKVLIDGVDISKLNDDELAYLRNKKIGFIFQSYNLINRTTVLRNVELPAIVSGMSKKERVEKAKKLLKAVGLESEIYRSPKYLSGGQQQRVAIARALMNDPTIILADEPTGNLDSKTGAEVMRYLRKMNEEFGTTLIVVTHDREVAEYAERIIHIKDGKVLKEEIVKNRRN